MPNVTIYIRKADLDKWKAISKKAEFISKCIQLYDKKYSNEPRYTPPEKAA